MQADFEGFILTLSKNFEIQRIYTDFTRRFAYGTDASCYRYVPRVVVRALNEKEILILLNLAHRFCVPLTFRAAGTSLSGQACSDGVLVLANAGWQNISVQLDSKGNAYSIICDCGVIGAEANAALKMYGKKIGPDPATINNALIGGIFSNNSSGMCCGVKQNSYQTIKSVRVILPDGFVLDTSENASPEENIQAYISTHKEQANALLALRNEIMQDEALHALIIRKFAIKNTTGYGINSLVDFADLRGILNHIFIGAEGTLGFVSRVEYECVEDYAFKACALIFYKNLNAGAKAVQILAGLNDKVSAAEIMDYACLKSAQGLEGAPSELKNIESGACAILVQLESDKQKELQTRIDFVTQALENAPSLFGVKFSSDEAQMASWWKIRKSLLPLAAASRPSGSIVITEDICFEIENFAHGIEAIQKLFVEYEYEGIIFGHALSGNVHFIITPMLNEQRSSEHFGAFMESMVACVVGLGGSTKAEHGTGRMVAPFVEREWGAKAYAINMRIKEIFDPHGLINPDVIITHNPRIHLEKLKISHAVEDYINACMECGFCEKVCPSREITLTPRQRISVRREMARLQALESSGMLKEEEKNQLMALQREYEYLGVETCATCSMCAGLCPLEIDTAQIALKLKPTMMGSFAKFMSKRVSRNFDVAVGAAKVGLKTAHTALGVLGGKKVAGIYVPRNLPRANTWRVTAQDSIDCVEHLRIIYLSTCINRAFAPSDKAHDRRSLQEVFESVCKKAGIKIYYPSNLYKLCCGKAFKDYPEISLQKASETLKSLESLEHELGGKIPIVLDHSACSYELMLRAKSLSPNLQLFDMPQFLETLLPRLKIVPLDEDIALYAMCATRKGKWEQSLARVARACVSGKIITHEKTQCCGFAGNKGFTCSELNRSALRELSEFYHKSPSTLGVRDSFLRGFASSSTCEIGLNESSPLIWQNILYLLDEVSYSIN